MRKKYLLIILPAMLVTLCLLVGGAYVLYAPLFSGPMPSWSFSGQRHSEDLQMNQKYYYKAEINTVESERDYFVFYKNGTGDFHVYHRESKDKTFDYTIHFRYSVSPSGTIICTYKAVYFNNADHTADRTMVDGGDNIFLRRAYRSWDEELTLAGGVLRAVSEDGKNTATYMPY